MSNVKCHPFIQFVSLYVGHWEVCCQLVGQNYQFVTKLKM